MDISTQKSLHLSINFITSGKARKKKKTKQHLENKGLLIFHSDLFHLGSCMSDFSHAVVAF